jgi:hypothetical protein
MPGINTLAYYKNSRVTAVKSFIGLVPDGVDDGDVEEGRRFNRLALLVLQHLQEVTKLILNKFGHRLLAEPEVSVI